MHVPGSSAQLRDWFGDEGACLDYLDWLRWAGGFRCPHCGGTRAWRLPDGRRSCARCRRRVSPTAGTLLHRTRTPLLVWFRVAWELTGAGTSALAVQRRAGLGSYQTAWAMLQRLRLAMGHVEARLAGVVEVDLARWRDVRGAPVVLVAVERGAPGRARLRVVADGRARTVRAALAGHVDAGGVLRVPVAARGVVAGAAAGWRVEARPAAAAPDGPRRVAERARCWLRRTQPAGVEPGHLQVHLDEVAFRLEGGGHGVRFHRLLRRALLADPTPYAGLVVRSAPGRASRPPAERRQPGPRRALVAPVERPWRRS